MVVIGATWIELSCSGADEQHAIYQNFPGGKRICHKIPPTFKILKTSIAPHILPLKVI
jgi:hypothetical protein